jgi:terminase, large subunit
MTTPLHPLARLAARVRPPPRYKISEFAREKAFVPFKPEAGKYQLDRMPWQKDMLDDPLDPNVNEIYWQLARRMGKSICICIICEYFICEVPSPILVVYPTLDAVKKWFRGQLLKMVAVTPCMEGVLKEPRSKGSDSTMLDRHFAGGDITGIGANSPAGLRSLNKRIILQEEIDAFENTAEGDAAALADGRADNFYNAVKLKTSTPGLKDASRIEAGAERGDGMYFNIPCAHCGEFFAPDFKMLRFSFKTHLPNADGSPRGFGEIRDTANARLVCPHCEWELTDQERQSGIRDGTAHWAATRPFKGIRSRYLNGMYRIMGKKPGYNTYLHEFSEMWLEHKHNGAEMIRVWVNNFEARTYEIEGAKLEWQPLRDVAKDENYFDRQEGIEKLPVEVMFVTAFADIHPDRVEIGVYGQGMSPPDLKFKEELWGLEHVAIYGDFDQPEMQERVWAFLDKTYEHPLLGPMKINCSGIDTGYQTKVKAAYKFAADHRARNVWAMKGSSDPLAGLFTVSDATKRYKIKLFIINVDLYKQTIFDRLEAGLRRVQETGMAFGARYIHFHKGYTAKFFQMLCSEKRVPEKRGGSIIYRWRKHQSNTRNEALDCLVGAMAAFDIAKVVGLMEGKWRKLVQQHSEIMVAAHTREALVETKDGKKLYELKPGNAEHRTSNIERPSEETPASHPPPSTAVQKPATPARRFPRARPQRYRKGMLWNPLNL